MDLTQRLDYDDDEEESSVNRNRPVGNLHMFAGIHGPAQDFQIYHGQNLIGRHASCDITLPAQSVSKKHAILEVRGDRHTICDNGSLNKTWLKKIALPPHERSVLFDGDFLLFADVACRYTIATVEAETLAVEESEDDSVLVPATQEALAAETPVAAIRRIARGPVLARDSGNEEGQTRWNKGGCGSFKDSHKTPGLGTIAPPEADTIVPESDEENDTSTSETRLPSRTLQCDSDADTSRRSSFVPSSQTISTPFVLKDQSKQDGRTLTTIDKEEMESRKPTDTEMKLRLSEEDNTDSKKKKEEQEVKSTSGGDVSEPCVEIVGTVDDDKLKQEHERILQDDAIRKPSFESIPVSVEDNVVSSRSELHLEDAPMQQNNVKLSDTDVKLKEDNVQVTKEANIQDEDTATSEADGNAAETSGIQTNKTEEEGNGRSLGSSGTVFHMERETDVGADEAGSGLEKATAHQVVNIEENENNANVPLTDKNEGGSDSAIDVEGDQNVIKSKSDSDEVAKTIAGPSTTEGTAGLGMDSDTDDDDIDTDISKPVENKADEDSRSNTEEKEGFHLDSETDVEEDDAGSGLEKATSHQVVNIEENENHANVPLTDKNEGGSDSAIDVEADQNVIKSKSDSDDVTKTIAEPNETEGTTGLGMNSDTDVDDIDTDVPKPVENKADEDSRSNTEEKEGFHLDSDTDVEEDMSTAKVKKDQPEPPQTSTKDVFNLDSDTDVDEEEVSVSSRDKTHGLQNSSAANTDVQEATGVDSDTDVDEDVQIPVGSNVTLDKGLTEEEPNGKADVVMAKEAAVLHVDSDTDVDDDGDVPAASVLENVGTPDGTTHADGAKKDTEITKEAAELHLDSDTDVEDDDGSSAGSRQEKVQAEEDNDKEAVVEDQKSSVSPVNEIAAISGISTEVAKNVPAEIGTVEDETQKSDSESVDLEDMPTQCYLEPESDLQEDEEEATQAFILSSTWAEPNPFKHPAAPIGMLQISSVTSNTSDDEIDENAIAETQAFCTEAEPTGSNVQETEEPVEKSVEKAIQSSSSGEESRKEVQQLSHETLSLDATQPVSQYLSTRASPETGTWLHLKREVPASVWIRGIQQEVDSADQEGGNEMTEDAAQATEQSLNLQLEATQLFSAESLSPAHTETPTVPAADKDKDDPEKPTERTEQPCSEDTQATDIDATQAHALNAPDSENGATQACSLSEEMTADGDTQATSERTAATENDSTQVDSPSVPAEEEVVPEKSSKSKEKLTSRRGLSRSKKPAENVPSLSGPEEHPDKTSLVPSSLTEESREQSAGEPQRSEPEIKEVQVEKGERRRGGRRNAESQVKTAAKEDVLTATTSQKRTSKKSSEAEPSTSGINKQSEPKQISSESTIHVVNEELKEEHKQSSTNTEEFMESFAPEILPGNSPEKIESLTLEDDKKGNAVKQMSRRTRNQVSSENKEILCTEASTSSTVNQSKMLIESNDDPAEKESNSHIDQSKKQTRNKRVATRLRNEDMDETQSIDTVEKEKDENIGGRNLRTVKKKDTGKQISELPQSKQMTQEESQGRKATRKSCVRPSEPESDKGEDPTASVTQENKLEEVRPVDPESGNGKSRRTRRSLKEEIKEESENLQKGKVQARRSGRLNVVEPLNKEKEQASLKVTPASNKITNRTRNNSKVETTKPEHEVKEMKIEGNEVHRKSRRAHKNPKEEQKSEDNNETQKTFSSEAETSKRTRRECREDSVVKEETVKETTRRTRRHAEEEDVVKLEDQTKKSRRTRKDSREGANTEETVKESCKEEDKVETVERKTTRKTNKNSDEKTSVPKSKQTEDNKKSPRLSKTRAKTSPCNSAHSSEVEEASKGAEESLKQSPHEDKSKPAVRRGRPAAKKEDIPPVSTPVASRKRGQATKAEVAVKRQKAAESEEQVELAVVETPKGRRGRPRKLVTETENTQTGEESSLPDPSPSRSTRKRSSSSSLSNTPESRTLRRKNCMSTSATSRHVGQSGPAPKILFTGVVDTEDREETIRSLGGDLAESVFDCTHLVTDRVIRTVKFLCALARGIPIVTLDWVDKCKKSGCFLSPTGFLVNDKEQEKKFNFTLSGSLQKAKMRPLFEGYEIHVTANVKPEVSDMIDIIRCSGATFLPKIPRSFKEKCVVVSCAEDASRCKSVPASLPITSAEFILSGILRQEVNPAAYLLDAAVLDTRPPPVKRRR